MSIYTPREIDPNDTEFDDYEMSDEEQTERGFNAGSSAASEEDIRECNDREQ